MEGSDVGNTTRQTDWFKELNNLVEIIITEEHASNHLLPAHSEGLALFAIFHF